MGAYAKTATGERLTYRPLDLSRYDGEDFCLRITPEDIDLERCFFVYLNEELENESIHRLFQEYFFAPKPDRVDEMESRMEPWLGIDPMLPKKYAILRQLMTRVQTHSGRVLFYINHGPGPIDTQDTVRSHLGTSVFSDGSFDDKILDIVLEFHADDEPMPELDQWAQFRKTDTTGVIGPTARVRRRQVLTMVIAALIGLLTLPLLLVSCRDMNNGRVGGGGGGFGGGFGGGML